MAPKAQAQDSKAQAKAAVKNEKGTKKEVAKKEESDEEDEEVEENWWDQENVQFVGRGEKRWDSLSHNGVLFPPEYEPHGIPILYSGEPIKLHPEAEEVATMFAVMKDSDYYRNVMFRRNFFSCWKPLLDKHGHNKIKDLNLCDFERIYAWNVANREARNNRSKEEKKLEKQINDEMTAKFKFCLWNGKKEQVANFRVEPPGLFRGRGDHPRQGMLKSRIRAEDITINIGAGAEVPPPPPGHKWGEVRHDNTVTWLAMWRDNVNDNFKYVMLAANSTVKGMADMMKFEKARKLKECIDEIRASYTDDFKSSNQGTRQRAVAMYFIDKLALRVGNEKDESEADTVGCCSLRVEHVTPLDNNILHFDFRGKDSIRYVNDVEVLPIVHQLVTSFRKGKQPRDDIFDYVDPTKLNDHLKGLMPGLSAKVFRTFNASFTLQQYFDENAISKTMSEADKLAYFNTANTKVAVLCNHQKAVSKGHHKAMMQVTKKIEYVDEFIQRLRKAKAAKNQEKAVKEFYEEEDKIQRAWLKEHGAPADIEEYEAIVKARGNPSVKRARTVKEESDDEDATIGAIVAKGKGKAAATAPPPAKKAKVEAKPAPPPAKKAAAPAAKKSKKAAKDDSDDDVPLADL